MKTPKRSSVKLFVRNLTEFFDKVSRECDKFIINSTFNDKTVIIRYVKGDNDVQR